MHDHWDMGYGADMGYGWIVMVVLWILLLAALVWFVAWLVMGQRGRSSSGRVQPPGQETPLEILDRRLATGEIDVDEYQKVRSQLTGKG